MNDAVQKEFYIGLLECDQLRQYLDTLIENSEPSLICQNFYQDLLFLLSDSLILKLCKFIDQRKDTLFANLKINNSKHYKSELEGQLKLIKNFRHEFIAHSNKNNFSYDEYQKQTKEILEKIRNGKEILEYLFEFYNHTYEEHVGNELTTRAQIDLLDTLIIGLKVKENQNLEKIVTEIRVDYYQSRKKY